jgi:hypothetical protein
MKPITDISQLNPALIESHLTEIQGKQHGKMNGLESRFEKVRFYPSLYPAPHCTFPCFTKAKDFYKQSQIIVATKNTDGHFQFVVWERNCVAYQTHNGNEYIDTPCPPRQATEQEIKSLLK